MSKKTLLRKIPILAAYGEKKNNLTTYLVFSLVFDLRKVSFIFFKNGYFLSYRPKSRHPSILHFHEIAPVVLYKSDGYNIFEIITPWVSQKSNIRLPTDCLYNFIPA